MRILHLEASSGWGGQEMRILKESLEMRKKGHEMFIAVMNGGALLKQAKKVGFSVFSLNFKRLFWPMTFFKLVWILWRYKIDLVNTHSSLDAWIGGLAARFMRCSLVRTRHLSAKVKPGFNSWFVYGYLADFVVTTCSSIIPELSQQSKKPLSHFQCVATGVDETKITYQSEEATRFRESLGVEKEDFLVGTACFMRSWKGIFDLLEAANQLRGVSNLRWVIIGGGHSETYIQKAKEMNLDGIVFFTGHLENPFPAIGALDLFALLSTANEGISQAILQAAFLEKPLLATKVGGLFEVCIDGKTGFCIPPHSPSAIVEKVLEFKGNRSLREEFGKSAKKLIEEKFTLSHMAEAMEKIFQNV